MHTKSRFLPRLITILVISAIVIVLFLVTAALTNHPEPLPLQSTAVPGMQGNRGDGIILPEMPADATQADYGKEVYRLVCSACHAYDGTGLTAEWISTWDPADQNCWQSKCHSANHPPDGFELPHYVPPIMGPNELDAYRTAGDLHAYIKTAMPWQDPGYLTDQEYWEITAYLIKANGFSLPSEPVGPDNAASFVIDPARQVEQVPAPAVIPTTQPANPGSIPQVVKLAVIVILVFAVIVGAYIYFAVRKKGS